MRRRVLGCTNRLRAAVAVCGLALAAAGTALAQDARFLAKEDILLYGLGLRVEPATQTVPKDIATIVSHVPPGAAAAATACRRSRPTRW